MKDWDPSQYLKFTAERTQPSIDLVSRIKIDNPKSIIDIGCGPGNSTQILTKRWPGTEIVGLDKSRKMIEKAKEDYPHHKWIIGDASNLKTPESYDIVFSNAALQWIPDHDFLLPQLLELANSDGLLAVQVPADNESPLRKALLNLAKSEKWSDFTSSCDAIITYHNVEYYYNLLRPIAKNLDMWETIYYHVLNSHKDLIEWYKGTGMRPFLERLPNENSRQAFEEEISAECIKHYEIQTDGKVLYPFKRIFFIVYK